MTQDLRETFCDFELTLDLLLLRHLLRDPIKYRSKI